MALDGTGVWVRQARRSAVGCSVTRRRLSIVLVAIAVCAAGAWASIEPTAAIGRVDRRAQRELSVGLSSPDAGAHCARGLDAGSLTALFARPIGALQGADYQRAIRLPDDRVLWTFQDAFVSGTLVHNYAMVQSGRCFTPLNEGTRSWLLDHATSPERRWHWILGGDVGADLETVHLFVVEMSEMGGRYLARPEPIALRRVVVDLESFEVVAAVDVTPPGRDLYGWSVTSDDEHTYLYSHCYRQFGHGTPFGYDECAVDVKLARVPRGEFDEPMQYWTGPNRWGPRYEDAVPVVDARFAVSGNNPAQVRFERGRFVLVEKRDDWWGETIEFGVSTTPQGPFRHVGSVAEPLKCAPRSCNTYFAAWVPWMSFDGSLIWSIGHNRWDGTETVRHLDVYRPTFHSIRL